MRKYVLLYEAHAGSVAHPFVSNDEFAERMYHVTSTGRKNYASPLFWRILAIQTKLDSQSLLKYTQIGEALRGRELEIEVLENPLADLETDSYEGIGGLRERCLISL